MKEETTPQQILSQAREEFVEAFFGEFSDRKDKITDWWLLNYDIIKEIK